MYNVLSIFWNKGIKYATNISVHISFLYNYEGHGHNYRGQHYNYEGQGQNYRGQHYNYEGQGQNYRGHYYNYEYQGQRLIAGEEEMF